jgi:hypothetical protein
MNRIFFFCVALFFLGCMKCFAQQDSAGLSSVPKQTVSSPFLKYKWLAAEVPNTCLLPLRNYAAPFNPIHISNLRLHSNWDDEPIFLSDYRPHASQEEYHAMLRSGLGFTYDPLNPYGVNSVSGSIIDASLNLFLMLMFPCK